MKFYSPNEWPDWVDLLLMLTLALAMAVTSWRHAPACGVSCSVQTQGVK